VALQDETHELAHLARRRDPASAATLRTRASVPASSSSSGRNCRSARKDRGRRWGERVTSVRAPTLTSMKKVSHPVTTTT
jgi:hypothetical protein